MVKPILKGIARGSSKKTKPKKVGKVTPAITRELQTKVLMKAKKNNMRAKNFRMKNPKDKDVQALYKANPNLKKSDASRQEGRDYQKAFTKAKTPTQKVKVINKQIKKQSPVKKQDPDDWVRTSIKFYRDEEKYNDMARAGKKLTDAQLKKYSKAIKMTTEYAAEIDGTFYNTRNHRDKMKGTVEHALDDLKDFVPKKYMDLYKKK